MPLIGSGTGSGIGQKDIFEGLLGYSLKREYFGEAFNYRNVETFTYDVYITDLANVGEDANTGRNYISSYIQSQITNKWNVDKQNINIKSIEIPQSQGGKDTQITIGTYKVTFEIRTKIDDNTMWGGTCSDSAYTAEASCIANNGTWSAQHPEIDPNNNNHSRYKHLQEVFSIYGNYIDGLNETIDVADNEDGSKTISHNISLEARDGNPYDLGLTHLDGDISAQTIAQFTAHKLLQSMDFNGSWGINVFEGVVGEFSGVESGDNQNHRYTESYDTLAGKYSFSRKTRILPDKWMDVDTESYKYSIQINEDGVISVNEDIEFLSQTRSIDDIVEGLEEIKSFTSARCYDVLMEYNYKNTLVAGTPAALDNTTLTVTSHNITYDQHARKVILSSSCTNSLMEQLLPYEDNYVFAKKETSISLDRNEKGISTLDFSLDLRLMAQKESELDKSWFTNPSRGGEWATAISKIMDYYDAPASFLSYWYSQGDHLFWGNNFNLLGYDIDGEIIQWAENNKNINPNPVNWTLLNTTATSMTRGKTFTLKKKWTDDPVYIKSLPGCTNCFTKIEPKITDSFPKNAFNEHPIVDREVGPDGNSKGTSVLSYGYSSSTGKRSVTLTAVIPRRRWNVLFPSENKINEAGGAYVPVAELKSLATYAKQLLFQLFQDNEKIKGFIQMSAYLSGLSYTFDSSGNVTLSADMTYGYKMIPPDVKLLHSPLKYTKI